MTKTKKPCDKKAQVVALRYDKKVTTPKKVVHQKIKKCAKRRDKKLLKKSWSGAEKKRIHYTPTLTYPITILSHTITTLDKTYHHYLIGSLHTPFTPHPLPHPTRDKKTRYLRQKCAKKRMFI